MTPKHLVQVKEESVDILHFNSQAFTDLWKTVIEKKIKIKSLSPTLANGQRIVDFKESKNAEMAKTQKRERERESVCVCVCVC